MVAFSQPGSSSSASASARTKNNKAFFVVANSAPWRTNDLEFFIITRPIAKSLLVTEILQQRVQRGQVRLQPARVMLPSTDGARVKRLGHVGISGRAHPAWTLARRRQDGFLPGQVKRLGERTHFPFRLTNELFVTHLPPPLRNHVPPMAPQPQAQRH